MRRFWRCNPTFDSEIDRMAVAWDKPRSLSYLVNIILSFFFLNLKTEQRVFFGLGTILDENCVFEEEWFRSERTYHSVGGKQTLIDFGYRGSY